jgi:hypothetical protein
MILAEDFKNVETKSKKKGQKTLPVFIGNIYYDFPSDKDEKVIKSVPLSQVF